MPITPLTQQVMQIEVEVDFEAHFDRAWDAAQELWDAEERERRRTAGVPDNTAQPDYLYGALSDCSTSPPHSLRPPSSPLGSPLPSPSPLAGPSDACASLLPPQSIPPPSPSRSDCIFGSDLSSTSSRPASQSPSSDSDANSEVEPGTSKRKRRREGWSPDKMAKEKARLKNKEKRQKAEGKSRPRKRSLAQKEKKRMKKQAAKEAAEEAGEGPMPTDYRLPKKALNRWGSPEPVETAYKMENATAAAGAYVGKNRPVDAESGADSYTLEGEIAKGRKYVPWDGMCVFPLLLINYPLSLVSRIPSTPHSLVDKQGRILGMMAGRPDDPNWMQHVADLAAQQLEEIRVEGDAANAWSAKQRDARRGDFVSITTGVSYGGGQLVRIFLFSLFCSCLPSCYLIQRPGNLKLEKVCQVPYVGRLLRGKPFKRMAGFANCAFFLLIFHIKTYRQR